MKRASATILVLLLAAGTMTAQEQRKPDYSRSTLMRLFVAESPANDGERIVYRVGAIDFVALGTSWKFNSVPGLFLPLSGTDTTVSQAWPDPFSLTQTQIATSPRAWRTQRELTKELERIDATERAKVRVTVGRQ